MDDITRTQRSRMLSRWLRHKPESAGLALSKDGWAGIPEVLDAFGRRGELVSRPELDEIVRRDPKERYEVENDRIRARYGHSLELEAGLYPGMPPATLYHGTPRRYVAKIMEVGLRPMKRQFVHLSPDRKTAREVGRRRDQEPAILEVAAHRAHEAGVRFYPRGKAVWISDPIPAEFLTLLEESPAGGQNVTPESGRAARESAPGDPRRRRPRGGFMKVSREP